MLEETLRQTRDRYNVGEVTRTDVAQAEAQLAAESQVSAAREGLRVIEQNILLMLVRRDNVEHLLMIGGPTDVVIEQNIVRAVPVAAAREAPPMGRPAAEPPLMGPLPVRAEPPHRSHGRDG